jgi:nitroreductase
MTGPLIAGGALREALRVPEGWEIAALIPLGFPAEEPEAPSRRPLSTLVRHAGDPPESGSEP